MASFDKYAPKLKRWEGGFANHPADPGGATMCGVTLATFRAWYGQDKTAEDLRRMTETQWRHIMKTGFWDKCWGDQITNQSVAEIIVDWCVNSGTGMIRKVQEIVGTKVDSSRRQGRHGMRSSSRTVRATSPFTTVGSTGSRTSDIDETASLYTHRGGCRRAARHSVPPGPRNGPFAAP